jgi:hypothetical protein
MAMHDANMSRRSNPRHCARAVVGNVPHVLEPSLSLDLIRQLTDCSLGVVQDLRQTHDTCVDRNLAGIYGYSSLRSDCSDAHHAEDVACAKHM